MKLHSLPLIAFLISGGTHAQDICHFTNADIPRNEARLLELARVTEFRCVYDIPQRDGTVQFIAERYQAGTCVSRQLFALGVHGEQPENRYKGTISFGWHMDDQKLAGVHDTGYFHQSGAAEMPGFHSARPIVWSFFKDAQAEPRTADNGYDFELYPIIGIRGSKQRVFNGMTISGKTGDIYSLPSKELADFFKHQPDAIIVYLWFGAGTPDLEYDRKQTEHADADRPATTAESESGDSVEIGETRPKTGGRP